MKMLKNKKLVGAVYDVNLDLSTPDSWHGMDVGIGYILLLDRS